MKTPQRQPEKKSTFKPSVPPKPEEIKKGELHPYWANRMAYYQRNEKTESMQTFFNRRSRFVAHLVPPMRSGEEIL